MYSLLTGHGRPTNMRVLIFLVASVAWSQSLVSIVGSVDHAANTVSTPTDTPGQGSYSTSQAATVHISTSGATICTTIDGSTPTATTQGTCLNGATHSDGDALTAFTVTTTLKAIGTKAGSTNSGVLTSIYTITSPAITFGQHGISANSTPTTAYTIALTGLTAGSGMVVIASTGDGSARTMTCSDSVNGSYSVIDFRSGTFNSTYGFYIENITGANMTITVTMSASINAAVSAVELKGDKTSGALRNHTTGNWTGPNTLTTTGNITASANDAVIVMAGNYDHVTTWTAGTPTGVAIISGTTNGQGDGNGNTVITGQASSAGYGPGTATITTSGSNGGTVIAAVFIPQ